MTRTKRPRITMADGSTIELACGPIDTLTGSTGTWMSDPEDIIPISDIQEFLDAYEPPTPEQEAETEACLQRIIVNAHAAAELRERWQPFTSTVLAKAGRL